ncbi:hypothetical protein [uncultured Pseudomonas sp.]|uniref:hypothetical protein n=1 Tax=uncultured Pseudomonas sp. TaxID=114707 RepID=UPI00258FF736|nr:hypothetical protein [uncultured Pseudomonas sp.]
MEWNFLVVEDKENIARQTVEIVSSRRTLEGVAGLDAEQEIRCEIVSDFNAAKIKIQRTRYDLAILDLREDDTGDELKGKEILEALRGEQFVPVIFYSGFAKKVKDLESPFVQVLAKGDNDTELLREAVRKIFKTRLPHLVRHIQERQREYLWDHIQNHWKANEELSEDGELAYLLARRLSSSLSAESIRGFLTPGRDNSGKVHPVEYYIWPSLKGEVSLGDLYRDNRDGSYYLVINPACDLDRCKTENALFVKCLPLEGFSEFTSLAELKKAGQPVSKGKRNQLIGLVGDNRESQPERYKYIPGTSFVPHLVADFQLISLEPLQELLGNRFARLATLDSPFAEAVQARFSRYYSRFGVPDLKFDIVADSLISSI